MIAKQHKHAGEQCGQQHANAQRNTDAGDDLSARARPVLAGDVIGEEADNRVRKADGRSVPCNNDECERKGPDAEVGGTKHSGERHMQRITKRGPEDAHREHAERAGRRRSQQAERPRAARRRSHRRRRLCKNAVRGHQRPFMGAG